MVVRLGFEPRVFWTKTRRVAVTLSDNQNSHMYIGHVLYNPYKFRFFFEIENKILA